LDPGFCSSCLFLSLPFPLVLWRDAD
jgi:hypothetical protein